MIMNIEINDPCHVLAAFVEDIVCNDMKLDVVKQRMMPFLLRLSGTFCEDAYKKVRRARIMQLGAVRLFAPHALDNANICDWAEMLRKFPDDIDMRVAAAWTKAASAAADAYAVERALTASAEDEWAEFKDVAPNPELAHAWSCAVSASGSADWAAGAAADKTPEKAAASAAMAASIIIRSYGRCFEQEISETLKQFPEWRTEITAYKGHSKSAWDDYFTVLDQALKV
jgi:hypothetical protein